MGLYDSIWIRCSNCGSAVEFQSKVGDCILKDYDEDEVPLEIAKSIDGDTRRCKCGNVVRAKVVYVPATVKIRDFR